MGGWCRETVGLENKTKIFISCTTADSVRGKSLDLVFCDEFAFVPTQIANEFMSAVRPTLGERVRFKNDYCIYS